MIDKQTAQLKIKYPLISIDSYNGVFRLGTVKSGSEEMHKLLCPRHGQQCHAHCAALAIARVNEKDVFVCRAAPKPIILGLVDFQLTSMEQIQALEYGSDLMQNLEASNYKRGK